MIEKTRDEFAIEAMRAILARDDLKLASTQQKNLATVFYNVASFSYKMADCMIKVRG